MSISALGFGKWKVAGPKARLDGVVLEEAAQEIGEDELQVLEADVFADPQAFALVKHRRVGRVAVDAVGAAGRDDADFRHRQALRQQAGVLLGMRAGITHLHRAGVRTQVEPMALRILDVDVEGVLHRPRRVVLGIVQRREAHPVGFDFRPFGNVEAH